MGSAVQQITIKCWCLQFQPEDQSFLIQSNVFANISTVLSNVEEVPETADKKTKPTQPPSEKVCSFIPSSKVLCPLTLCAYACVCLYLCVCVCVCMCVCVYVCVCMSVCIGLELGYVVYVYVYLHLWVITNSMIIVTIVTDH